MPFNVTLVLSVPHVHSRFSLKNGKRYPDARLSRYFLFFSPDLFFGIFLQSISWKWQFGNFF